LQSGHDNLIGNAEWLEWVFRTRRFVVCMLIVLLRGAERRLMRKVRVLRVVCYSKWEKAEGWNRDEARCRREGHKGGNRKRKFEPESVGIPILIVEGWRLGIEKGRRSWVANIECGICTLQCPDWPGWIAGFVRSSACYGRMESGSNSYCRALRFTDLITPQWIQN
jgi:hypothetical protein